MKKDKPDFWLIEREGLFVGVALVMLMLIARFFLHADLTIPNL